MLHDKADVNWTVVEDVWTTGSGALSHRVPGLAGGQRYDVQVRAIRRFERRSVVGGANRNDPGSRSCVDGFQ